jgi:hypothetical protein
LPRRVNPGSSDVGVRVQVPVNVEERVRVASFAPTEITEVLLRKFNGVRRAVAYGRSRDVRICQKVELAIEGPARDVLRPTDGCKGLPSFCLTVREEMSQRGTGRIDIWVAGAAYGDVAGSGMNPLTQYDQFDWKRTATHLVGSTRLAIWLRTQTLPLQT